MCKFTEYQLTLTDLREEKKSAKNTFVLIVKDLDSKLKNFRKNK